MTVALFPQNRTRDLMKDLGAASRQTTLPLLTSGLCDFDIISRILQKAEIELNQTLTNRRNAIVPLDNLEQTLAKAQSK